MDCKKYYILFMIGFIFLSRGFIIVEATPVTRVSQNPSNEILYKAHAYYDMGQYDKALHLYFEYAQTFPGNLQVHSFIGDCYKAKKEYKNALNEYTLILDSNQIPGPLEKSHLFAALGDLYLKMNNLEIAVKYFDHALELSLDANMAYDIGQIFYKENNTLNSLRYFKQAVNLNPNWCEPYLNLGYIYMNSGELDEAVSNFKKYLKLFPDTPQGDGIKELIKKLSKTLD